MARRRRKEEDLWDLITQIISLLALCLLGYPIFLYITNRQKFWQYGLMALVGIVLILAVLIGFLFYQKKRWKDLLKRVKDQGLEEEILNFISRFGKEKTKSTWTYRTYVFDLGRLSDFEQVLNEKGLRINEDKLRELLEYYIGRSEYRLTAESVKSKPNELNALDGGEFEVLLKRLFEAMGYAVQSIGRVGDQGGDLIANKGGKRFLIQAKRYTGSVGNAAVQQATAAKTHYDCTSAVVVTTGEFTREAKELAKTTQVQLVGKDELQHKLMEYLKENWS